jgi:phosphatidylserine/phosphatidylglycerophosphate/cardiolipin synthase-like enzyme
VTDAITPTVTTPSGVPATHMVQIARTFRAGTGAGFQPWSPNGERTILATLKRAIDRAKRYIYIEEQYLVAPMLSAALLAVLAKPDVKVDIVIVISDQCADARIIANQDAYDRARYLFLKDMINHPRVQVFSIKDYYVHTKATIVDDIFATIGTANMNRRGLTHDAELNAFILDGRVEDGARKLARDLRTRLWSEHLGMPLTAASFSELNDVGRALDILRNKRPSTAHLIPYTLRNPGSGYTFHWESQADPIGF